MTPSVADDAVVTWTSDNHRGLHMMHAKDDEGYEILAGFIATRDGCRVYHVQRTPELTTAPPEYQEPAPIEQLKAYVEVLWRMR